MEIAFIFFCQKPPKDLPGWVLGDVIQNLNGRRLLVTGKIGLTELY